MIRKAGHRGIQLTRYFSSSFEEGDIKKAEEYVVETLRSRSWTDYMISNYYPKSLRMAYCTIQLFNLELMRISDNIKEPSLGMATHYWQDWEDSISGEESSTKYTIQKNQALSRSLSA